MSVLVWIKQSSHSTLPSTALVEYYSTSTIYEIEDVWLPTPRYPLPNTRYPLPNPITHSSIHQIP